MFTQTQIKSIARESRKYTPYNGRQLVIFADGSTRLAMSSNDIEARQVDGSDKWEYPVERLGSAIDTATLTEILANK